MSRSSTIPGTKRVRHNTGFRRTSPNFGGYPGFDGRRTGTTLAVPAHALTTFSGTKNTLRRPAPRGLHTRPEHGKIKARVHPPFLWHDPRRNARRMPRTPPWKFVRAGLRCVLRSFAHFRVRFACLPRVSLSATSGACASLASHRR